MPNKVLKFGGLTLSTKVNGGGQPIGNSRMWISGDNLATGNWIKVFDEDPRLNANAHAFWQGKIKVTGSKAVAQLKYSSHHGQGPGVRGIVDGEILAIFVTLHPGENDPAESMIESEIIIDAPDS